MTIRELLRRSKNAIHRALWAYGRRHRKAKGKIAALQIEISRARQKRKARKHLAEAMKAARIEQMRAGQ